MAITIHSDNPEWKASIQRYFKFVLPELNPDRDVLIVDVNLKEISSDRRTDRKGIQVAQKFYDDNTIIILMSFETEESLKKSELKFRGLMSHSNVGFVRLPGGIDQIEQEIKRIISGNKKDDPTEYALYFFENRMQILAQLQHNMGWVTDPHRRAEAIERAKEAGLEGTDEEIIEQVRTWKRDSQGFFSGKELEGIFVDALNTLFDSSWEVNKTVLEKINAIQEKTGKTVFIISDSEEAEVEDAKKNARINWQLLSKFTLRGAILDFVIDDLSEEEFKEKYNITPKNFITVSELQ